MWNKYYRPKSLDEALEILAEYKGRARVIAGGTDLILQLQQKKLRCDALVDISGLEKLRFIGEANGTISLGALATHTEVATSPLLAKAAPMLAKAARSVGSLQIRNVGTVGGNVVNGQPAADVAVALSALEAEATIASAAGSRKVPILQLYKEEGGSLVDPTKEIIVKFSFPSLPKQNAGGTFLRLARRKELTLPVLNAAATLWLSHSSGIVERANIVLAPVVRIPFKARAAEEHLLGKALTKELLEDAAGKAASAAAPRDSAFRGSAAYRKKVARVLVYRALLQAWETMQSGGKGQ